MEKNLDRVPREGAGCVIMASGLGRRFGGNKLLADFGGEPLICRAFRATEGIFDCRVVVTRHPEVEKLCRERGIAVVLHDLPLRSDTVRLGLQAVGAVEGCLFCPGDQPLLRRETVAALVEGGLRNPGTIWRRAGAHRCRRGGRIAGYRQPGGPAPAAERKNPGVKTFAEDLPSGELFFRGQCEIGHKKTRRQPRNCGNYSLTNVQQNGRIAVHTVVVCPSGDSSPNTVILPQEPVAVKRQV